MRIQEFLMTKNDNKFTVEPDPDPQRGLSITRAEQIIRADNNDYEVKRLGRLQVKSTVFVPDVLFPRAAGAIRKPKISRSSGAMLASTAA
jgi:hypothetical protein